MPNASESGPSLSISTLPDPAVPPTAPPLDPGAPVTMASGSTFLYAGPNPQQTGVAPGTINPDHVAVLRGAVKTATGTALAGDKVVVNGGRVLCVTAMGDSVKMAQRRAYQAAEGIHFDGMQFRRDIGHRAIAAKKQ